MKITRDWMDDISLACQGVLMLAMRGPDNELKETAAKQITRAIRAVCLNGAHFKGNDDFMGDHSGHIDPLVLKTFSEDHDQYPHHWILHLTHAAEVVGYLHPDESMRYHWHTFYLLMVTAFHMQPETKDQMLYRLRERYPPYKGEQPHFTRELPDDPMSTRRRGSAGNFEELNSEILGQMEIDEYRKDGP